MTNPTIPPRTIDCEILAELGRVVTGWAVVEAHLAELLAGLVLGDPGRMYLLTQEVSGATLSGWIRTACHAFPISDATRDNIVGLLLEIDDLRADRNVLVHGVWATGSTDANVSIQTVRWSRTEIGRSEVWDRGDVREVADAVADVAVRLGVIVREATF